jgi:hypothetical protein
MLVSYRKQAYCRPDPAARRSDRLIGVTPRATAPAELLPRAGSAGPRLRRSGFHDSAGGRGTRRAGVFERDLLRRIVTELRGGERQGRASDPTALGRSSMNTHWREHLLERLERGDSLEQIASDLRRIGGLSEEARAALWLLAWGKQQRRAPAGLRPRAGSLSSDRRAARNS